MEDQKKSPLSLNRVDPTQQMIEGALSVLLLPTLGMLLIHCILIFITSSWPALLVVHGLFAIALAVLFARAHTPWQQASTATGFAGFVITLIAGILFFFTSFTALHFFTLLTQPFMIAAFDAIVCGIAVLIVPLILRLYQKQ